ncbi:MAG TPA: diguanylate cyclase [Sulfuriferula sp.]|nr:diguanylate cyclase [Sulfuriferula sp.]
MESPPQRRASDRREPNNRRGLERRSQHSRDTGMRFPTFSEQRIQFSTRYLFFVLGWTFFNMPAVLSGQHIALATINIIFAIYFVFTTAAFYHAWRQPIHPARYRWTMWIDIALVATCMVNDPYDIPPSLVVFIMIVLGNGMRYGMRMFGEALIGSFLAIMLALTLRFAYGTHGISAGMIFLNLFGGIILIYAYILMSRIETAQHLLERSSKQDTLTGLMNRRGLVETGSSLFDRIATYGGMASVMFVDLDQFKRVNDNHGHAHGDQVLRRFADILFENTRASDINARYGGDEFVILMPETQLDQSEQVARRIQAAFAHWCAERGYQCSATIGIGEAPRDGRSLEAVLDKVDAALYHSKAATPYGGLQRVDRLPGALGLQA